MIRQAAKPFRRALQAALLNLLLVWLRLGRPFRADRHAALLIPPDDPGSIGDEAMVAAAIAYLRRSGFSRIGLVTYGAPLSWDDAIPVEATLSLRAFFNNASRLDELRFARFAGRHARVYVLGADVMDGYYSPRDSNLRLRLLTLAARTGAPARLLGFSFNDSPSPETVRAFRQLPPQVELCARDPLSRRRLLQHLDRPVRLTADLAFLLEPAQLNNLPRAVLHWMNEEKQAGRMLVGINANYLAFKHAASPDEVIAAFARALEQVFAGSMPVSFLLIPHDARDPHSDVSMAANIHAQLPPAVRGHSLAISTALPASRIKALCGRLDFALSSRMHLAIACLGQGVPVACVTYQGKFEGLFEHFGLENMLMDSREALSPGTLPAFLADALARRDNSRAAIAAAWPQVRRLAENNFAD